VAAISAAAPDSRADASTYESADVQMTVTSQTTGLPDCHGISVMPSGRFPSVRLRPAVSFETEKPAEEKALATTSFKTWCLAPVPGACLHTRLRMPHASTCAPQRQRRGAQIFIPSRIPTATLTASSSNFNPHDQTGRANNQSPCTVASCGCSKSSPLIWNDEACLH